jgi:kynurenine formamidase
MRTILPLALFLFCACATTPRPVVDLAHSELVDLTYAFDENTLYWPNSPSAFQLQSLFYGKAAGGYFYSSNAFAAPEHGGTHLDAPIHFSATGATLDQLPLSRLIAPAVVIDVTAAAGADSDYRLTVEDVRAWESRNGLIPSGAIVLLRTGWGSRYGDRKAYFGDDTPGATNNLHFPSYGAEAARLLVTERKVAAIGVDTASIDYGRSADFIVHQIASAANVPGFENVANLERVPERGSWVIALPMKIAKGSGAPLRIVAVVPNAAR